MHISACLLEGAVTTASLLCIRSSGAREEEVGKRMLLQDSPLPPERRIVQKAYRLHL